jgi:hypothetical protein
MDSTSISVFVLGTLFGIIGWLLSRKDSAQGKQISAIEDRHQKLIDDLYQKHRVDVDKLAALELQIARNHYEKGEVTAMFSTFKNYLDEKFTELKASIHEIGERRAK